MFHSKIDAMKVSVGTQTYVTQAKKRDIMGCVNWRASDHGYAEWKLRLRSDFCHLCGADGFYTKDCPFPHGVEHQRSYNLRRVLELFSRCSGDLSLYCPESPECNVRYSGIVDYLRLNYSIWLKALIPPGHRYLVDPEKGRLKRRIKVQFDANDHPSRVSLYS